MAQLRDTTIDGNLGVNGFLNINTIDSKDTIDSTDSVLINGGGTVKQTDISNLNIMSKDLLWENASPTSEFPAQDVSLDLSKYIQVEIEYYSYCSSKASKTVTLHVGDVYPVEVAEPGSVTDTYDMIFVGRRMHATETGVSFEAGYYKYAANPGTQASQNSRMTPTRIYGIII